MIMVHALTVTFSYFLSLIPFAEENHMPGLIVSHFIWRVCILGWAAKTAVFKS